MPHFPYPFVGAGWADYPTIFVEAGLEIPYSVEGFDQAMQNNFKESVAVAFDVQPIRVKIVKINVAAPHAPLFLTHGCEVFISARVPGGDEAKAQLILAVTLERVNMQPQVEQNWLNTASTPTATAAPATPPRLPGASGSKHACVMW